MIRKAKVLELMNIFFIINLNTFGSNVLQMMDFENVALTKVVHIYVIKGMDIYIYDIKKFKSKHIYI